MYPGLIVAESKFPTHLKHSFQVELRKTQAKSSLRENPETDFLLLKQTKQRNTEDKQKDYMYHPFKQQAIYCFVQLQFE